MINMRFLVASAGSWLLSTFLVTARRLDRAASVNRVAAAGEHILILRMDAIGDVVLSTGMIREVRMGFPDAHIELVVKKEVANLVELCPYVNRVTVADSTSRPVGRLIAGPIRAAALGRRIRLRGRPGIAVNPRWDTDGSWAGVVGLFSGAERRFGFSENVSDRKSMLNTGFNRFYSDVVDDAVLRHEVERTGVMLLRMGITPRRLDPEMWIGDDDRHFAEQVHVHEGQKTMIAVAPGASGAKRMWPGERFAAVARRLAERFDAHFFLLGSSSERPLTGVIENAVEGRVLNLSGRTTLRQAAALIERAAVYIGNDSGLLHIAAASGTPTVEISCHPVDGVPDDAHSPDRFAPWGNRSIVVQPPKAVKPCRGRCESKLAHCIATIEVDDVVNAAAQLLEGSKR